MENAMSKEAGSVIGQLMLAGVISERQHEAGLRLYTAWSKWQRMAEMPARNAKISGYSEMMAPGPRPDVDPEAWAKARGRYEGARGAVGNALAWAAVDSLVIDGVIPNRVLAGGELGARCLAAMLSGLDSLVRYFGVQRETARTA